MLECPDMQKVMTSVNTASRAKLGIRPGDTVRVEQKIIELKRGRGTDKKEKVTQNARTQAFEGLVLAVKHGTEAGASFTVRATLSGVGVEKTFPLYSPAIDSIEIIRRSKVRRAKLYFIREKAAKEVKRQLRNARRVSITEDVEVPVEIAPTVEDVAVAVAEEAVAE
jgi:large subunit ribosomal protein L19